MFSSSPRSRWRPPRAAGPRRFRSGISWSSPPGRSSRARPRSWISGPAIRGRTSSPDGPKTRRRPMARASFGPRDLPRGFVSSSPSLARSRSRSGRGPFDSQAPPPTTRPRAQWSSALGAHSRRFARRVPSPTSREPTNRGRQRSRGHLRLPSLPARNSTGSVRPAPSLRGMGLAQARKCDSAPGIDREWGRPRSSLRRSRRLPPRAFARKPPRDRCRSSLGARGCFAVSRDLLPNALEP